MSYTDTLIKIFMIIFLSMVIGFDREIKHKPAGVKTHILVGLGSTVFMLVSIYMYYTYKSSVNIDPARIAAQVVTGIGFLGAGTIIQSNGSVQGLTTAASLWSVAAIGLAVGSGMYFLAIAVTAAILIVFLVTNKITAAVENEMGKVKKRVRDKKNK